MGAARSPSSAGEGARCLVPTSQPARPQAADRPQRRRQAGTQELSSPCSSPGRSSPERCRPAGRRTRCSGCCCHRGHPRRAGAPRAAAGAGAQQHLSAAAPAAPGRLRRPLVIAVVALIAAGAGPAGPAEPERHGVGVGPPVRLPQPDRVAPARHAGGPDHRAGARRPVRGPGGAGQPWLRPGAALRVRARRPPRPRRPWPAAGRPTTCGPLGPRPDLWLPGSPALPVDDPAETSNGLLLGRADRAAGHRPRWCSRCRRR